MARNGFPRMAISACFGGPVLSKFFIVSFVLYLYSLIMIKIIIILQQKIYLDMLLGIGVPYTYLLIKNHNTLPSIEVIKTNIRFFNLFISLSPYSSWYIHE